MSTAPGLNLLMKSIHAPSARSSFFGAEVGQPKPKSIESFAGRTFDFVITLCDKSLQSCQNLAQAKEQLHWNIPDPRAQSGDEGFDKALTELNERIKFFVLVNRR